MPSSCLLFGHLVSILISQECLCKCQSKVVPKIEVMVFDLPTAYPRQDKRKSSFPVQFPRSSAVLPSPFSAAYADPLADFLPFSAGSTALMVLIWLLFRFTQQLLNWKIGWKFVLVLIKTTVRSPRWKCYVLDWIGTTKKSAEKTLLRVT